MSVLQIPKTEINSENEVLLTKSLITFEGLVTDSELFMVFIPIWYAALSFILGGSLLLGYAALPFIWGEGGHYYYVMPPYRLFGEPLWPGFAALTFIFWGGGGHYY